MKTNNSTSSTMDVLQQFILAEKSSPPPKAHGNDKTSTIIPSPNKLDRKVSLDGTLDRRTSLDGKQNEFTDATGNGKNSNTVEVTSKANTLPRKSIAKAKDKGYEKNLDRRNEHGKGDSEPKVGYKQFSLKSILSGGKSKKFAKIGSEKSGALNRNGTNNGLALENGSNGLVKENGSNIGHGKDEPKANPFTTQLIRESKQSTRDIKLINDTIDGIDITDNNAENLQNGDSNDSDIVNSIERFNDTSVSISFGRTSLKENNRQMQDTRGHQVVNNNNNSGQFAGIGVNNKTRNLDNSKNGTAMDKSNTKKNENKEDHSWISAKRSIKSATLDSGASRRRGNEFISQEKEFVTKSATLNGDGSQGERVTSGKPPISPKASLKEKLGTGGANQSKASLKKVLKFGNSD
ncbi:hypothetical protein WDU94_002375 [Cyamophila willieti]